MARTSDPHDVDLSGRLLGRGGRRESEPTPEALREFNIALSRVHPTVLFLNPLGEAAQPANVCQSNATVLRFDGAERENVTPSNPLTDDTLVTAGSRGFGRGEGLKNARNYCWRFERMGAYVRAAMNTLPFQIGLVM